LSALSQADERIATSAQNLGLLSQALQALDEDESVLRELLADQPQNPVFHRRQALVHSIRSDVYDSDSSPSFGDPARALESSERYLGAATEMVRSDPANTSARFSRAVAMYSVSFYLREFDANAAVTMARDSVRMFDQMVGAGKPSYLIASRRVRALRRLGEAQLQAGHVADARASAQSALDAERTIATGKDADWDDEHSVMVQLLLLAGKASAASGDFEHAESRMREAREEAQQIAQRQELTSLIPLVNAEEALGTFYAQRRRIEEARTCYERLIGLWQHFPETNEYVDVQKAISKRWLTSLH
jgi:tetratricopeptide (TPR) repeat protein